MCEDEMEDVLMEWKMCFVSVSAKLPEKWLCSADLLPKRNTSSVWQIFRRFVVRGKKTVYRFYDRSYTPGVSIRFRCVQYYKYLFPQELV
jgi:hypothetical protein